MERKRTSPLRASPPRVSVAGVCAMGMPVEAKAAMKTGEEK